MIRRRNKMRQRLAGGGAPALKMTALMDIFSTLLLFLLKSFVAEGQAVTVTPGVTLPSSEAQAEPHEAPVIALTDGFVALEGRAILTSEQAHTTTGLELAPLYEALVTLRESLPQPESGAYRVVIQGDRRIEFRLLQRVMYTSQLAGWTDVSLAVLQDSKLVQTVVAAEGGE
jgi:biopolymer transport protein ExbD